MQKEYLNSKNRVVDEIGRVVIPRKIREVFELKPGTEVAFSVNNNNIIIKK